ncbi:glycosyltransferase family 1 protein [Terriglobus sp.]|uniref:glycosyltransferase family 1 protein n=1 Tax=Terriglobus sp. TaxID=1889013 RepID=UPI003B0089D0
MFTNDVRLEPARSIFFLFFRDWQVHLKSSFSLASSVRALDPTLDIFCFSHLRWDFVRQRPQHLLSRAAQTRRVFYWEEPFRHGTEGLPQQANVLSAERLGVADGSAPRFGLQAMREGEVTVLRPHLCSTLTESEANAAQAKMLQGFQRLARIRQPIAWYYTPMALAFTTALRPSVTVYDCMDELSLFHGAPPELRIREQLLLEAADVVFTGGVSLYEAKRHQHGNVYAFPSSIDVAHFATARLPKRREPEDQAGIARPRAGFSGVLDERLDAALLEQTAKLLPEVQFVLVGPVVKIDPATLPKAENLHYLGGKRYEDLPAYLGGWDVALLPFAKNEATRFISPTKTPEYLAAGLPVVSTSIRDVVRGYGDEGLLAIADTPEAFAAAIQKALLPQTDAWRQGVARKLAQTSWDRTWSAMEAQIARVLTGKQEADGTLAEWPLTQAAGMEEMLLQNGVSTVVAQQRTNLQA